MFSKLGKFLPPVKQTLTVRNFSKSSSQFKSVDLTATVKRASQANAHYDSSMDLMEVLHRREGVAELPKPPLATKPFYRVDDFPHDDVSRNAFKTPKSSVGPDGSIIPVHKGPGGASEEQHVEGKRESKVKSPFTSVTHAPDLPAPMMPELKGWGKKTLVIDPKKVEYALSPMEAQSEMRRKATPESFETARTKEGQVWHWKTDSMFDAPERQEEMIMRIAKLGIDPHKASFSRVEKAQIFNESLGEHLIKGQTGPGAVTDIVPTSEAMEAMRKEKATPSDEHWLMNQINEALNRRG